MVVRAPEALSDFVFGIQIATVAGTVVFGTNTALEGLQAERFAGDARVVAGDPGARPRAGRLRARRRGPRPRRRAVRLPARRAALRGHGRPRGNGGLEPGPALELFRRDPMEAVASRVQVDSGRCMRSTFLPFARPSLGEEEIREVVDTLRSGWITTGPKTERFAAEFLDYVGGRFAVPVSSATAGLHAALLALGVGPGDEVVTTPLTFVATLNTIVHCGAVPVLADVDAATLQHPGRGDRGAAHAAHEGHRARPLRRPAGRPRSAARARRRRAGSRSSRTRPTPSAPSTGAGASAPSRRPRSSRSTRTRT